MEVWKALNVQKYPLSIEQQSQNHEGVITRADTQERPFDIGRDTLTKRTCISDAIRLWNLAPEKITQSTSVYQAKQEIKKFVQC